MQSGTTRQERNMGKPALQRHVCPRFVSAPEPAADVYSSADNRGCLAVFGPLVLATNLVFLLGSEIVLDVESLADLLRGLPLDHVRNRLASDIEQGLDI